MENPTWNDYDTNMKIHTKTFVFIHHGNHPHMEIEIVFIHLGNHPHMENPTWDDYDKNMKIHTKTFVFIHHGNHPHMENSTWDDYDTNMKIHTKTFVFIQKLLPSPSFYSLLEEMTNPADKLHHTEGKKTSTHFG